MLDSPQESADNVSADSVSPSKDDLLEEACKKYDEATRLCPTLYDVCIHWLLLSLLVLFLIYVITMDNTTVNKQNHDFQFGINGFNLILWQAYYNWAIAISDRAKMRGRTKEAEELWEQVSSDMTLSC